MSSLSLAHIFLLVDNNAAVALLLLFCSLLIVFSCWFYTYNNTHIFSHGSGFDSTVSTYAASTSLMAPPGTEPAMP